MATDFPNSPANGATHTFAGNTYTYNSTIGAWTGPATGSGGGASVTVSETAPSSPAEGDLWFDPSVLKTFVYYNDGSANQWVQSNPTGSGGGGSAGASVTASDTAPSSPSAGDLWYKSDTNALYVYYNDGDSSQWVGVSGPAGAAGATGAAGAAATGYGQVPIVYTEPPTSHALNKDGSTSTVQMQAVDPEGTAITYAIAYANATNARPNQLAADTVINQSTGTFTFDPSTNSSHAGNFKARLSASDGITHATRFVDFSLSFNPDITYLIVAGGGGGGTQSGGGGGAGGLLTGTTTLTAGTTYTVTVGAGGNGSGTGPTAAQDGGNSVLSGTGFTTLTAIGGGKGGIYNGGAGGTGGSGGGGAVNNGVGGSGTSGQGNAGAAGGVDNGSATDFGGGGGGAGEAGNTDGPGHGGDGVQSSITGTATYYAGGGAGAHHPASQSPASGGQGGGGAGVNSSTNSGNGYPGTANTGGGGGAGSEHNNTGGAGGSGVVIIRTTSTAASTTGSPTLTTDGSFNVYKFTANGTITF